jgi:hypothetical protein
VEQVGVVAAALQEALVQDYDRLIRIAPAVPSGWDFDGNVFVRGRTKVDVQVRNGIVTTAVIEAGATQVYRVRNPWLGQAIDIVSEKSGKKIVKDAEGTIVTFHGEAGQSYLIERRDLPTSAQSFEPVRGGLARTAKKLGQSQIGLLGRSGVSAF